MYVVYVLKSQIKNWHYVGMTSNLENRIKRHNTGRERTTRFYKPFDLIYKKLFPTRYEARDYEKFLNIRSNKEKLLESLS